MVHRHILSVIFLIMAIVSAPALAGTPQPQRSDIRLEAVMPVNADAIRIARDPITGTLFYLTVSGHLYRIDSASVAAVLIDSAGTHGITSAAGFTIGPDGTFYLVGNIHENGNIGTNTGIIKRGRRTPSGTVWSVVAQTVPYPRNENFNHEFNAVEVTPDARYLLVNSGARTDHGEAQVDTGFLAGMREIPLTSKIFRLPIDGQNIVLQNNLDSLQNGGYLFASGVRNTFDMAFGPDGGLFGAENSGDRDNPEELNWLKQGNHYGFPWHFSLDSNPQQFPGFTPDGDPFINHQSLAWKSGYFHNDPEYPAPPQGIVFTSPVLNVGPDADYFRDSVTGLVSDASSLHRKIGTFTPHRTPLGLVFDNAHAVGSDLTGDGFILCWNDSADALLGPFGDPGEDLLDLKLNKITAEDRYEAQVTRIVGGFQHPVDAVIVGNVIYVLEMMPGAKLWKVILPSRTDDIATGEEHLPVQFSLKQNYPNPFNPTTDIGFRIPATGGKPDIGNVTLKVFDLLGQEVATLVNERKAPGEYHVHWNASGAASGVYFYRLDAGTFHDVKKLVLLR